MIYKVKYSLLNRYVYCYSAEPVSLLRNCVAEIDGEKFFAKAMAEVDETSVSSIQLGTNHIIREAQHADEIHYDLHARRCLHFVSKANKVIQANDLNCKVLACEPLFDVRRIIFYFKTRRFVNLRLLIKEMRTLTETDVDFRQVEGREITKLVSDIGACGLETCCTKFLFDTPIISKEDVEGMWSSSQASLGMCGRIKCCATYEKTNSDSGKKNGSSCSGCSEGCETCKSK